MLKKFFNCSRGVPLILIIIGDLAHASPPSNSAVMVAQTTQPSVGHRTNTPSFGHEYRYNGYRSSPYDLKYTPLPGFHVCVNSRNHINDEDNKTYSAGENIENYRSIYHVDSSGNETVVEKNVPVSIEGGPCYIITDKDIGNKLKFEYFRRSSSTSFTPSPNESYFQHVMTDVVSPDLLTVKPILYVNGIVRSDYIMYSDEVGYLRYKIINTDGQPVGNINIVDAGGSGINNGTLRLEPSTININGEVERKITASKVKSEASLSISAHYNGYNLWPNSSINITIRPSP